MGLSEWYYYFFSPWCGLSAGASTVYLSVIPSVRLILYRKTSRWDAIVRA